MIKVSIILPVFNAEDNIRNTIESVLNQTLKEIELIIIDDGSTDNSFEICQEMKKIDNRIVLKTMENNGVSNARNIGIEVARGKYIMFIDDDDEYDYKIVEKMIKKIETTDLAVCNFSILKNNGKKEYKNIKKEYECYKLDKMIAFLQKNNLFNVVWNKIYKKEIIINNNIRFNTDISIGEDLEFNLKYFEHIKKIACISESLYIYRVTTSGLNYKYHEDRIAIRKKLYDYEQDFFERNKFNGKLIYNEYIKICLAELKQIRHLKQNDKIMNLIKEILYDKVRRDKLQQIKNNGRLKERVLGELLSHMLSMIIIYKIIEILKR